MLNTYEKHITHVCYVSIGLSIKRILKESSHSKFDKENDREASFIVQLICTDLYTPFIFNYLKTHVVWGT